MNEQKQANWYLGLIRKRAWKAVGGAMILMGLSQSALAQIIDRVEILRSGDEAEIVVHLTSQVQYVRHTPAVRGDTVLIFFWLNSKDSTISGPTQEIKKIPDTDLVSGFTVAYPVLGSALGLRFKDTTNFRVRQGEDGRSFSIYTPITVVPPEAQAVAPAVPAVPLPQTPEEVELRGQELLGQAKDAYGSKDYGVAIGALNQLLNLPPNNSSMEAQELIGIVREEYGEYSKARAEYELYLKVYPDSPNAPQIRERLDKLVAEPKKDVVRVQRREPDKAWQYSGSIMQYYYGGKSQIEIFTPPPPGQLNYTTQNLSATDQSALVTNLDVSARKRTETTDHRIVFRQEYTLNFLKNQGNRNRIYDAYYEQSSLDRERGYLARLGRQSGNAGGVMGRFDGLWAGYHLNPQWRINATVGSPVEFNTPIKRSFYGASVDLMPQPEKVTGSLYAIQQRTSGVVDREAVGMEIRYFDDKKNVFGLIDYDTSFKAINIATAQGNWQTSFGSNFFFLADHRKSPMLLITSALQGEAQPSIQALLNTGVTAEELRRRAAAVTSDTNVFQVGVTHQATPRWQIGGDIQVSYTSATQGTATVPAMPATGNRVAYSVQAHGNSVVFENDFAGFSGSMINEQNRKGYYISFNHVGFVKNKWRIESLLGFYRSKDNLNNVIKQTKPSVKVIYDMRDDLSFEAEAGLERRVANGPAETSTSTRSYVYFGYRWSKF